MVRLIVMCVGVLSIFPCLAIKDLKTFASSHLFGYSEMK